MPPVGRRAWLARLPAFAVLAALAIDVAGGRWGAYVLAPIPRPAMVPAVYLADLLWVVGCIAAVGRLRGARMPRLALVAGGVVAVYVVIRAVAVVTGDRHDAVAALVLRDLSTFGYVALIPLAALALVTVSTRALVRLLRICPLVMVAGLVLSRVGAPVPAVGAVLGGADLAALPFPGRADIAGIVMAIGIVAWGRFDQRSADAAWRPLGPRLVQALLVVVGVLASSQAGQVAIGVAIGWAVVREVVPITRRRARIVGAIVAVGLVGLSVTAGVAALSLTSATTVEIKAAEEPAVPAAQPPRRTSFAVPEIPEGFETITARLSTWSSVLHASAQRSTWLVGTGIGQPDTLLAVCNLTMDQFGDRPSWNKCDVDSGQTPQPLRDPHNWMLTLLLYHGVVGIVVFAGALLVYWWRPPPDPAFSLTAAPAALYALAATMGVVFTSPFGLVPLATFTAFALSRRLGNQWGGRVRTDRPNRVVADRVDGSRAG